MADPCSRAQSHLCSEWWRCPQGSQPLPVSSSPESQVTGVPDLLFSCSRLHPADQECAAVSTQHTEATAGGATCCSHVTSLLVERPSPSLATRASWCLRDHGESSRHAEGCACLVPVSLHFVAHTRTHVHSPPWTAEQLALCQCARLCSHAHLCSLCLPGTLLPCASVANSRPAVRTQPTSSPPLPSINSPPKPRGGQGCTPRARSGQFPPS